MNFIDAVEELFDNSTKANDPATPLWEGHNGDFGCTKAGLTKREHFAALAMQAILTGHYANGCKFNIGDESISKAAVESADALIEALNAKP